MKWVLAGMTFALVVGLAVATVAIKVQNLAARQRIEKLTRAITIVQVEYGRRAELMRQELDEARLLARLEEWRLPDNLE